MWKKLMWKVLYVHYDLLTLKNGEIKLQEKTEKAGCEKGKLLPTDLGVAGEPFPDAVLRKHHRLPVYGYR